MDGEAGRTERGNESMVGRGGVAGRGEVERVKRNDDDSSSNNNRTKST